MTLDNGSVTPSPSDELQSSRARVAVYLFGLAILHGLILNLMPVMFTTMEEVFQVNKAQQALLKSCFFGGSAAALVVAGYLTHYVGVRWMTLLLGGVAGAGGVLFGLAPTYPLVLTAACLLGMGVNPLAALYAAVIAERFVDIRQRMYMWIYGLLAATATVATYTLGALLDTLPSYNVIFIYLGVITWGWIALVLAVGWPELDRSRRRTAVDQPSEPGHTALSLREKLAALARFITSGVFTRGALYVMSLMMILDYLCVSNMLSWVPSFFEEIYTQPSEGPRAALGGAALSASSAGVCVGRILMGTLPQGRIPDRLLLAGCYGGGVICFGLIVLLRPLFGVSLLLMFLSGAFISAQAPAMGSLAVAKFGDRAPIVVPMYEGIGMLAGLFGPPLLGWLADRTGQLGTVLLLVPTAGLALAVVALIWYLVDREQTRPAAVSESQPTALSPLQAGAEPEAVAKVE